MAKLSQGTKLYWIKDATTVVAVCIFQSKPTTHSDPNPAGDSIRNPPPIPVQTLPSVPIQSRPPIP